MAESFGFARVHSADAQKERKKASRNGQEQTVTVEDTGDREWDGEK